MIIEKTVYMNRLQRERKLTIYAPDDYQYSGKRYPVMYINDGQNAFFDDQAYCGISWGFLDYVQWKGLDLIMVAIPCNFEPYMREAEYGPWVTDETVTIMETCRPYPGLGGEGEDYLQFLATELKPMIDAEFPTDPEDTAIVGSSAGGIISAYATLRYPQIFKKCAALSTAFWYYPAQFEALIKEADLSPISCFYLDLGSNEGVGQMLISNFYRYYNDHMYSLLKEKGIDDRLHYAVYEGAIHHESEWRKRVPVFMELFYPDQY